MVKFRYLIIFVILSHCSIDTKSGLWENKNYIKAALDAGPMRFRAILLTSITTFIGVLPLIFERSIQAKFLVPMAVSLGFGVLFSTFVTLILVPTTYVTFERIKEYLSKISDDALYAYNVYQIEGEGRTLFSNIEGDEDTIMGLPVKKIKEYINSLEL